VGRIVRDIEQQRATFFARRAVPPHEVRHLASQLEGVPQCPGQLGDLSPPTRSSGIGDVDHTQRLAAAREIEIGIAQGHSLPRARRPNHELELSEYETLEHGRGGMTRFLYAARRLGAGIRNSTRLPTSRAFWSLTRYVMSRNRIESAILPR
jgi:hypothetical protein